MRTLLSLLVLPALFIVGCMDTTSDLTSSDTQISEQSNSPNWVKLNEKEGMSVEHQFSITKNIDIELCKEAI